MRKLFSVLVCVGLLAACGTSNQGASILEEDTKTAPETIMFSPQQGNKVYELDAVRSSLGWKASKVTGTHHGTLALKQGTLEIQDGTIIGGNFAIDMGSMVCLDLTDPKSNERLVNHLKSDDFFSVEKFPEVTFAITSVASEQKSGMNFNVTGDLMIKGITNSVTFPANITEDNGQLHAVGTVVFDRTKWDIKFRSGSFFENMGDNMIYDEVEVTLDLRTK